MIREKECGGNCSPQVEVHSVEVTVGVCNVLTFM